MECPYCGAGQEVCHDDGCGYEEDRLHEHECSNCDKTFTFTTSIIYCYKPYKSDCLNGSEHKLKKVNAYPPYFPDWVRCQECEYERRGEKSPNPEIER